MFKKILIVLFIFQFLSTAAFADETRVVEVYNVKESKVIKAIQPSEVWQKEAEKILKKIDGVYIKYDPMPKSGFVIKIPLEPSVMAKGSLINEVTVFFPNDEEPYLMIYDDENTPHFYTAKINEKKIKKMAL